MRRWMIGAVLGVVGLAAAWGVWAQQVQIPMAGGVLLQKFTQTLNPTQDNTNLPLFVATSITQTFTVSGLATSDAVFISGPAPSGNNLGCSSIGGARVSAANTLSVTFIKTTTAGCTPATGTYVLYAIRVNP